jgi:hypothetical protein
MATTKQAKAAYQKEYNARPEEKERRRNLGKQRYKAEKEGKVKKGQDMVHPKGSKPTDMNAKPGNRSKNRSQGGKIGNRAGKAAGGRKSAR